MGISISADGTIVTGPLVVTGNGADVTGLTILRNGLVVSADGADITGDSSIDGDLDISGALRVAGTIEAANAVVPGIEISPETVSPPFALGANAQGQLVTGLNADLLDGLNSTDFVRNTTAGTVTAVHTFSPATAGAPFELGANAQGQLVTGLNADLLDGLNSTDFVRNTTAGTITAVHTFNPATPAAPFILGANGCGQLITGLNADLLDGYDVTDLPLLAGRANGQTLYGGINAQGNLVLNSTSHYTKGQVCLGMDGSKIAVGTSPANILGENALATFFSNGSLFIELAGDVNAAGNVIAEIIGVAKYNLITDYDFRRQASLAIVMEGTTDLRRGSRIEIKTRMDNDGPVGARRVATFTTCGNLNIGTSGQGPSVQCSGAVFLEYGINPVSTRAGHSGFFTSLTNGVYTASCINGDGNIIKFMRQAKISLTSAEMYSLTCPFGTPGDTLTNISADWTDDTKTAIRNNFRSLTRSINSIIGVVADIRTKLDTFIAQHVTAGFNAS